MTKNDILTLLENASGTLVSGGKLAQQLGISRAAVWKQIAVLQQEGYQIEAVPNKGYILKESDVFSLREIQKRLKTEKIGKNLVFLEETGSTNADAKHYAASHEEEAVFAAAFQTGGKGRLSRSFSSPRGMGIYLSALLRPDLEAKEINSVTLMAAVAVADAIQALAGVDPSIKWINDLYLNGKKICGILTECAVEAETGKVQYLVIGIGVNLSEKPEDFPEEIRDRASSVYQETGKKLSRSELTAEILFQLEKYFYRQGFPKNKEIFLQKYRDRLLYLGEEIQVIGLKESYPAIALDIDEEGCLLVKTANGEKKALNSGEISIRPKG